MKHPGRIQNFDQFEFLPLLKLLSFPDTVTTIRNCCHSRQRTTSLLLEAGCPNHPLKSAAPPQAAGEMSTAAARKLDRIVSPDTALHHQSSDRNGPAGRPSLLTKLALAGLLAHA